MGGTPRLSSPSSWPDRRRVFGRIGGSGSRVPVNWGIFRPPVAASWIDKTFSNSFSSPAPPDRRRGPPAAAVGAPWPISPGSAARCPSGRALPSPAPPDRRNGATTPAAGRSLAGLPGSAARCHPPQRRGAPWPGCPDWRKTTKARTISKIFPP